MKAILISIKPKYVAKILNGEKTIEIRKTMPKCDLPIDVYIYCTKEEVLSYRVYSKNVDDTAYNNLNDDRFEFQYIVLSKYEKDHWYSTYENMSGKVVAKFTLNKVELIRPIALGSFLTTLTLENKEIIDKSCLTENEIRRYLTNMHGYAWYISNLVIFDKPKELSEFKTPCKKDCCFDLDDCWWNGTYFSCEIRKLTKAPQSWCYCEIEE